jgi:hypothetical protein
VNETCIVLGWPIIHSREGGSVGAAQVNTNVHVHANLPTVQVQYGTVPGLVLLVG